MRIFRCLLLVAVFPLSATADVATQVRCREIAFSQSAEARDSERFASFLDADARFVGNSVARGVAAVVQAWGVFFAPEGPAIMWRPRFVEVLEDGRLALSRGPYRMLSRDEQGAEVEHWGTFNSVWRLQADGSWKIVFDAGSPSAVPPSDEDRALLVQPTSCD